MFGFQMTILFNRILDIVIILLVLKFVAIRDASAYIDPGSGSYLLQILAAGVLSSIFIIKKFWGSINKFVSSIFSKISGKKN